MKNWVIFLFVMIFSTSSYAGDMTIVDKELLIWNTIQQFRSEKTGLYYGLRPQDTPSIEDIKNFRPLKKNGEKNTHGGASGMEDCSLFNGTLLSALLDKYSVQKDDFTKNEARKLYQALKLNATAHGDKGFVARGVSPRDGKTVYAGTSVDQYTHFIYGMLKYYNSSIASKKEKCEIADIFTDIAEKMIREICSDTISSYSFKFYKGMFDDRGTGKMIFTDKKTGKVIAPSERLPMVYAAAYAVTKSEKYYKLYEKYIDDTLDYALKNAQNYEKIFKKWSPAYVSIQKLFAFDVLRQVEKNKDRKAKIETVMHVVTESYDKSEFFKFKPDTPRKRAIRDCAEILHAKFLDPLRNSPDDEKFLLACMKAVSVTPPYAGTCYTILGAYWCYKSRRK